MVDDREMSRPYEASASRGNGLLPEAVSKRLDSESIENIRNQISVWDERARTLFQERPIAVVAGALVAGYLFGRIFSRRWP